MPNSVRKLIDTARQSVSKNKIYYTNGNVVSLIYRNFDQKIF